MESDLLSRVGVDKLSEQSIINNKQKRKIGLITSFFQKQDIWFCILIAIALLIKLWKAKYGISEYDEAFYLSVPHRMFLGDRLFVEEWHPSQMSGFLLYPFFILYMRIFSSTEGIQIFFRYIYIAFHFLVVIFIYYRTRKYGFLSVVGSVLYFLFAPFQLLALSYNTLGMDFLILTAVIMITTNGKKKIFQYIIAGSFFALAVLCCPYLIVGYFGFFIVVLVVRLSKKQDDSYQAFSFRSFLGFSIGCVIIATLFFSYVLSKTSIMQVIASLKYVLSDPGHLPVSIFDKTIDYFGQFLITTNPLYLIPLFIYIVGFVVLLFDKKRIAHRTIYLIIASIFCCAFLIFCRNILFNAFMIPISFLGLYAFVLSKEKRIKIFVWGYLLGIVYSLAINYSSNTGIYAKGISFSLSTFFSFIFINDILRDSFLGIRQKHLKDILMASFVSLAILLFAGIEVSDAVNHCLWDGNVIHPIELGANIEEGPSKGIVTTYSRKELYDSIYNDVELLKKENHTTILCLTNQAWIYLALEDFDYGTYSAWLPENETTLSRLEDYYSTNPNKVPYYVYIPDTGRWDDIVVPVQFFESKGYTRKKINSGYILQGENDRDPFSTNN